MLRLAVLAAVTTAAALTTVDAGVGLSVPAVPVQIEDIHATYVVRGEDAPTLTAEMTTYGPQHPTGRRAWAYTAWEVSTRYELDAGTGGCTLSQPRVSVQVSTTLPQWTPTRRPGQRLRRAWRRLLVQLEAHEAEHRRHALTAARATAEGLAALPAMPDCRSLERQARLVLRRAVAAAGRESRAFDRATDFGAKGLSRPDE